MGLIPKKLLTQDVSIYSSTPSFEGGKIKTLVGTYKARIEIYKAQQFDIGGDLENCNHIVYLDGDINIKTDNIVIFDGTEYVSIKVDKHYWINGAIDHTKVYLT